MTLKRYISLMGCLLLAACSAEDDAPTPAGQTPGEGEPGAVRVELAADGLLATRAVPGGTDNLQNVTDVYLYVYDDTGETLVWQADVQWDRPTGGTERDYYHIPAGVLTMGKEYTFVAVGMDEEAKKTYRLETAPQMEKGTDGFTVDWETFPDNWKDAAATDSPLPLADQMLQAAAVENEDGIESVKQRIAKSEILSGSATQTMVEGKYNKVEIDLQRRMAGVMAYLTNIPEGVTAIRLVAHQPQLTNVPLLPLVTGDFVSVPMDDEDKRVVLEMEIDEEYLLRETNEDDLTKQTGSALRTAYMLPLPAPKSTESPESTETCTFTLELVKGENVDSKDVVWETTEPDTEGNMQPVKKKAFAIEANHFYSIGSKDATTDDPYDLGGLEDEVVIYVDGNWQAEVNIPM